MGALRAMTAQELLEYSHEPYRTELLAGRLVEMEPADALHGLVAARIGQLLANHVRAHGLGEVFGAETGFHLVSGPDTVRAPDASFVSRERVAEIGIPNEFWPGPPDVAFEVTSPGDRRGSTTTTAWAPACSHERVLLSTSPRRRTAVVHRAGGSSPMLSAGEPLDLDDVLPGFSPPVHDLFA